MAAFSTIAAVAGAVAAVGGTAYSAYQGNKAGKVQRRVAANTAAEQARARKAEERRQNLAQARERRKAIRGARIARANALSAGTIRGISDSSTTAGSVSSIGSQTASNLSFLDQQGSLINTANSAISNAAALQSQVNPYTSGATTGSAIAGLGSTIFSNAETLGKGFNSIFGTAQAQ